VTVSWPEAEEATTFIVFWCRNRNGNCEVSITLPKIFKTNQNDFLHPYKF
jgi:hypothetical protein